MTIADGNLATTYNLIYAFLIQNSHPKVAKALQRAVKNVVILKEEQVQVDTPLNEIIFQWKVWKENCKQKNRESSSNDTVSSSSDESDSQSDTSQDSSEDTLSDKPCTSSETESSEKESAQAGLGFRPKKTVTKKEQPVKEIKADSPPSPSSSSSSESNKESESQGKNKDSNGAKSHETTAQQVSKMPLIDSVALKVDVNRVTATKKRRTSMDGTAVTTAISVEKSKGHKKDKRKPNMPFQRIKADEITYHDERLKDNTFLARNGAVNDYGAKAHRDLVVTRGAGFRKEKNKKKRGGYRGGEITMQSHSIKFT